MPPPVPIPQGQGNVATLGGDSATIGDGLPAVNTGYPGTVPIKAIDCGSALACVTFDVSPTFHDVRCWGGGVNLGLFLMVYAGNSNIGDDANEMGNNLPSL